MSINRSSISIGINMKHLLRHKWNPVKGQFKTDQCSKCGIVREWDQNQFRYIYYKRLVNGSPIDMIGYFTPQCILENCTAVFT